MRQKVLEFLRSLQTICLVCKSDWFCSWYELCSFNSGFSLVFQSFSVQTDFNGFFKLFNIIRVYYVYWVYCVYSSIYDAWYVRIWISIWDLNNQKPFAFQFNIESFCSLFYPFPHHLGDSNFQLKWTMWFNARYFFCPVWM